MKTCKFFYKIFVSVLCLLLLALCLASLVTAFAEDGVVHWYCKRNADHRQPSLDTNLHILEDCGGIFLDRSHGDTCEDKVVYLTFDAGYENGNVEKILDVLKEEEVGGAFFILGHLIDDNPDLVLRMANEGHLVCHHTTTHKNLVGKGKEALGAELSALETKYEELTGKKLSPYFRPPEGTFDETLLRDASSFGYRTVLWSFAYADWDNDKQMPAEKAKEKILANVHNGAILLLHPTSATNAAVLPDVIRELRAQGYRFGSLDEIPTP